MFHKTILAIVSLIVLHFVALQSAYSSDEGSDFSVHSPINIRSFTTSPFDYVFTQFYGAKGDVLFTIELKGDETRGGRNFFSNEKYDFCLLKKDGFQSLKNDRAAEIDPEFVRMLIYYLERAPDPLAHGCEGQSDSSGESFSNQTLQSESSGSGSGDEATTADVVEETHSSPTPEPTPEPTPVPWAFPQRTPVPCGRNSFGECAGHCPNWYPGGETCQLDIGTVKECFCSLKETPQLWPTDGRPVEQFNMGCNQVLNGRAVSCEKQRCGISYPIIVFDLQGNRIQKTARVVGRCYIINRVTWMGCACKPSQQSS